MKKKVAFYIESMVVGGAEKVLIDLVNNLDLKKYEVTVIALFKKSIYSDFCFQFEEGFQSHVKYKYLVDNTNLLKYRLFNYLNAHLPKSLVYRYLIKDSYDVEVAFYEGWPTEFVSFSNQKSCKIAWLHTDQLKLYQILNAKQIDVREKIYHSYNQIVGVSQSVCQSFTVIYPNMKPLCIYNPIQEELICKKAKNETIKRENVTQFVTVGRLISVKGYERLISALAKSKREGFSFNLWIIGDGEERDKLKALVKKHHLEQEICFLGQQSNPYPYIKSADCLICSSYAEGLSTVVIEAIILGKPVITTNCSGMEEIFGGLECGYICENSEEGLYLGIRKILVNPSNLVNFQAQAKKRRTFFSLKERMINVEMLLDKVSN